MKALVYTQPNEVQVQEYPSPTPGEEEVVLRIDAVGICGSDMHAYHGHDPRRKPGLVLGHEFAGTVVESRSSLFSKGARVTGNPLITCGYCEYCVQGRNNLCANRTMVGMTRPGAFAEYMSIPASCLIAFPDDMSADMAALTEPAATALHAVELSKRALKLPIHQCRTLVIGGGAIGMFSGLLLRHLGVTKLDVAEINDDRRAEIARTIGCGLINPKTDDTPADAYDFVIDCVGSAITRRSAFVAVKAGGVVMHVGLQDWASEIDMRKLTLSEITLLGTYTYTTQDLKTTVEYLYNGVFGSCDWVDRRPLDHGPIAFQDLHHGRTASAKILLKPFA